MKNRILMIILPVLACFALLPGAQAVSPAPDGCYPNYTTAEGCNALQFLAGGFGNTGIGWYSLYLAGDSNYNTGVGGGALALNTGGFQYRSWCCSAVAQHHRRTKHSHWNRHARL